jgi:hypothetical protein
MLLQICQIGAVAIRSIGWELFRSFRVSTFGGTLATQLSRARRHPNMNALSLRVNDRPFDHYGLSDKIEAAFYHACRDNDLAAATQLAATLELVLLRTPPSIEQRDGVVGAVVACQEHLWHGKHGRPGAPGLV